MSYALEYLSTINYDDDSTALFFKDELKVCLYHFDQKYFIDTLAEKYKFLRKAKRDCWRLYKRNSIVNT